MQPREQGEYIIIRYYFDIDRPNRIMQRGLTWQQAQRHVNDPTTKKEGVYFDGFQQVK